MAFEEGNFVIINGGPVPQRMLGRQGKIIQLRTKPRKVEQVDAKGRTHLVRVEAPEAVVSVGLSQYAVDPRFLSPVTEDTVERTNQLPAIIREDNPAKPHDPFTHSSTEGAVLS